MLFIDLDTLASSIAYSWLENEIHHRQTIALVRCDHADLALRNENVYALGIAGLSDGANELLYMNDLTTRTPFPSQRFALVDHNNLDSAFSTDNSSAQVITVIDHHEDEGLYKDTANPRIIAPVGSCASLVARLCPPTIPPELALLLLSAILIDTGGLKTGGKAVEEDRDAAVFLVPLSPLSANIPQNFLTPDQLQGASAIQNLYAELETKKVDVSNLSVWDLLRRDYKEYTLRLPWAGPEVSIKAGLSTVPLGLEAWITEGRLQDVAKKWMDTKGLTVHGILTSYRDPNKPGKSGKGKHRRQQLWIVSVGVESPGEDGGPPVKLDDLVDRLFKGLKASKELKLKRNKNFEIDKKDKLPAGMKARVYDQKNTDASRKVTAPTLKRILEGEAQSPDVEPTEGDRKRMKAVRRMSTNVLALFRKS